MNSKITKLKTSEVTKGFMGKLILTYFILIVLNLTITYLFIGNLTYRASIISTIISTAIFCVMALGIKNIFDKSENASLKELLPSPLFFLNSLGINVIISLITGLLFVFLFIVIFVVFFAILPITNLSDFSTGSIIYSDAYLYNNALDSIAMVLLISLAVIVPIMIFLSSFISNITALAIYAVLCEDNTNLIKAFSFGFKSVFKNFKYFLLLSFYFSGLALLAIVTCGLSLIYTIPRTRCVQYQAYTELTASRIKKDDFGIF